jgi:hypothetical protein
MDSLDYFKVYRTSSSTDTFSRCDTTADTFSRCVSTADTLIVLLTSYVQFY